MSTTPVQIIDSATDSPVDAELLDGLGLAELDLVEREWSPERSRIRMELARRSVPRDAAPESLHWNWATKRPGLLGVTSHGFAVVRDNKWEGMMLTKSSPYMSRLAGKEGLELLYLDFLEKAPWNWNIPEIGQTGRFQGIGSVLFNRAVGQSIQEGFKGRIGLHSLVGAEGFYLRHCGMIPVGRDRKKQNLLYLELDEEGAKALYKQEAEE